MNAHPSRPSATSAEAAEEPPLLPIRELLSYRLHRVANALSRSAALRYRREFGVTLHEWRTIALLGSDEPLTVNRLARLAGIDKAQMSRVIAKLTARNLIEREPGPGRTTQLTLTRGGRSLYRALIKAANERNDAFLVALTPTEQEVLDSALSKLAILAKALEHSEH